MNLLEVLEEIASHRDLGPSPAFNEIHVMGALELLGSERRVGRLRLSSRLALGEGSVRTILKHLKAIGLVEGTKKGYALTEKGRRIYGFLKAKVVGPIELPRTSMTFGKSNVAFLVKKAGKNVKRGLEQRDAAIRVGAEGAITLICRSLRLTMPSAEQEYTKDLLEVEKIISEKAGLGEDDVLIIGVGMNRGIAETGAKAAVLDTLRRQEVKRQH